MFVGCSVESAAEEDGIGHKGPESSTSVKAQGNFLGSCACSPFVKIELDHVFRYMVSMIQVKTRGSFVLGRHRKCCCT